jgi:hypothetical protein
VPIRGSPGTNDAQRGALRYFANRRLGGSNRERFRLRERVARRP